MKIKISDIPYEGRVIAESLSLEALNERLNEGADNSIVFTETPKLEIKILKQSKGGHIVGKVTSKYKQDCARCLDEQAREMVLDVNVILREKPVGADSIEGEFADDIGVFHYEDDTANLEEIIQELILLDIDIYWSPELQNDSTCSNCNKDCSKPLKKTFGGSFTLGTQITAALKKNNLK